MPTGATGQLGLALPVQGELSGTWGNTVNNAITEYTNIAIAATLTLTNDGAVTLANTTGTDLATNITSSLTGAGTVTAQFAIVRVTGTLTTAKVITAPSYSKTYTVVNAATGGIVTFKASGQTGVSIAVGESAFVYFNGTDYVKLAGTVNTGVTSFQTSLSGLTPSTSTTGAVTLAGTLGTANGGTNLTSFTSGGAVYATSTSALTTGTLPTASGGTNLTSFTSGGVVYASSSSALATGSILSFDGSVTLGVGITPNLSGAGGVQMGNGANRWSWVGTDQNGATVLAMNTYYSSGYKYAGPYGAGLYLSDFGAHKWFSAASGTANAAISFTQAMTLTAAGRLGIGLTSPTFKAEVWGDTATFSDATRNFGLFDTQSAGSGAGGGIAFGGYYNGTTDYVNDFAGIQGMKENGTAGNYAGCLRFTTRVNGGNPTERARISSTGGFSVGTTADPGAGAIYATGNITAYYSDARLKTVSGKIENALDKVAQLSGVYYTNNDTAKSFGYDSDEVQVGVLAQEVEAVLPQIVKAAPFDLDQDGNSKSGENYKTVQYDKLVPLLIEAINELRAEVKALKGA